MKIVKAIAIVLARSTVRILVALLVGTLALLQTRIFLITVDMRHLVTGF